jgi:hypothetical protein
MSSYESSYLVEVFGVDNFTLLQYLWWIKPWFDEEHLKKMKNTKRERESFVKEQKWWKFLVGDKSEEHHAEIREGFGVCGVKEKQKNDGRAMVI